MTEKLVGLALLPLVALLWLLCAAALLVYTLTRGRDSGKTAER